MTTSQHLLELTRQTQVRMASAEHLRAEHRIITQQSTRRLAESRLLLDRSLQVLRRQRSAATLVRPRPAVLPPHR